MLTQRFEVGIEGADFQFFGVVRVAVAAEVQRENMPVPAKGHGQVVPPVGVGSPSMKKHDGGIGFIAPMERTQKYTGTKGMGKSLGSRLHGSTRYRSLCVASRLCSKPLFFSMLCNASIRAFESKLARAESPESGRSRGVSRLFEFSTKIPCVFFSV